MLMSYERKDLPELDEEEIAQLQNLAAPCCSMDYDGDWACPAHYNYRRRRPNDPPLKEQRRK